jgi:hypothetical protein
MSARNGDKSRFNRVRKQNIHRRERNLVLREALYEEQRIRPKKAPGQS